MSGEKKQKQSNQTDGEMVFIAMDPKKLLSIWDRKGHIHMLAFSVCSNKVFSQVASHKKTLICNTFFNIIPISSL